MAKKKWATKAFDKASEGSLGSLSNPAAIVAKARKNRGGTVRKLLLLANGSGDAATRAKAKSIISRIKRELGEA
jgi:hypothetical protein